MYTHYTDLQRCTDSYALSSIPVLLVLSGDFQRFSSSVMSYFDSNVKNRWKQGGDMLEIDGNELMK